MREFVFDFVHGGPLGQLGGRQSSDLGQGFVKVTRQPDDQLIS